jgi:hypothetical protein
MDPTAKSLARWDEMSIPAGPGPSLADLGGTLSSSVRPPWSHRRPRYGWLGSSTPGPEVLPMSDQSAVTNLYGQYT